MPQENSAIGLSWAPKVPPLTNGTKNSSEKLPGQTKDSIWRSDNELVDGLYVPPADPRKLNKLLKKNVKDTAGGSWFDMPAPTITPELKKDLEILKLRSAIDPKRHFKRGEKSKALPKYFQVGTVIEPASEFFSGRLTKKERKATLADELLSDHTFTSYRKRKVQEIAGSPPARPLPNPEETHLNPRIPPFRPPRPSPTRKSLSLACSCLPRLVLSSETVGNPKERFVAAAVSGQASDLITQLYY